MADYLVMVLEDEGAHASQSPHELAELLDRQARFADELRRTGRLRDSGRFRPSKSGVRVRGASVDHGPFAEDGRAMSAYYWLDASSLDEATKLVADYPGLATDMIDVRPLLRGAIDAGKDDKPGKIFAFAVLGTAASEDGWNAVMERIDAETRGTLTGDAFIGGLRLQPPTTGRRIARRGDRRAMFDGPFLESKEVIGGLFLVRMMSIDEAVEYAVGSRFVVHGALEIRELWRT